MSLAKRGAEPMIPGFRGGHRIDESTGNTEKGEYSFYLEQAEQFLQEVRDIKAQIKQKEKATIPGRKGEQSESLKELSGELKDCEDLIRTWASRSDKQHRVQQLKEHMAKLEQIIPEAQQQLGIPDLQQKVQELKQQAEFLITHDRMIDMALRNMPDSQFLEKNV